MVFVWDTVNFGCLGKFTTSINKSSREKTLPAVSLAVGKKKRMFRELCAPCDHRRDKRGMDGFFLFTADDGTLTGGLQIEPGTELEGIKERKPRMYDLEIDLD